MHRTIKNNLSIITSKNQTHTTLTSKQTLFHCATMVYIYIMYIWIIDQILNKDLSEIIRSDVAPHPGNGGNASTLRISSETCLF